MHTDVFIFLNVDKSLLVNRLYLRTPIGERNSPMGEPVAVPAIATGRWSHGVPFPLSSPSLHPDAPALRPSSLGDVAWTTSFFFFCICLETYFKRCKKDIEGGAYAGCSHARQKSARLMMLSIISPANKYNQSSPLYYVLVLLLLILGVFSAVYARWNMLCPKAKATIIQTD